jgi:hypothetical protein
MMTMLAFMSAHRTPTRAWKNTTISKTSSTKPNLVSSTSMMPTVMLVSVITAITRTTPALRAAAVPAPVRAPPVSCLLPIRSVLRSMLPTVSQSHRCPCPPIVLAMLPPFSPPRRSPPMRSARRCTTGARLFPMPCVLFQLRIVANSLFLGEPMSNEARKQPLFLCEILNRCSNALAALKRR